MVGPRQSSERRHTTGGVLQQVERAADTFANSAAVGWFAHFFAPSTIGTPSESVRDVTILSVVSRNLRKCGVCKWVW